MFFSTPLRLTVLFILATVVAGTTVTPINCDKGYYVKSGPNRTLVCKQCPKGSYNPTAIAGATRATSCTQCEAGKFQDRQGASACCSCCQGYYSENRGATHCTKCPTEVKHCGAGSRTPAGCSSVAVAGLVNSCSICSTTSSGMCPSIYPPPTNSGIPVGRRRDLACPRGFTKCPHLSGQGGFDCLDISKDPESCGGCALVGNLAESGRDCTTIPNVSVVNCKASRCIVVSCRVGFVKSSDGKSCRRPKVHFQQRSSH